MFLSVHAVTGCKSDDKVESLLSYHISFFFSFCFSVQDYKIHVGLEIVVFA
jgi:hypothetical protein